MFILELPVIYHKNYAEREEATEAKLPMPEPVEEVIKTTFYVSTNDTIRTAPVEENRTILYFLAYDLEYAIDGDYETVNEIIKSKLKSTN